MKRAIGYARVSTTTQEKNGTSLETQHIEIRKKTMERGYQLIGIVSEDHTGTELDERPQLSKIRQMIKNGEVDTVIVWSFDRLARKMVHQGHLLFEMDGAGVELISVKENFDDSPEGNLLRQVVAFMAEKEHGRILERTQAGRRRRVENGKPLFTRRAPYGYRVNAERTGFEVNPETAPVAVRIFEMVATGMSIRSLCRTLSKEGVPTPDGAEEWGHATISGIVSNPIYWGKAMGLRHKSRRIKSSKGGYYTAHRPDGGGVLLPSHVAPALISEDLAMRAQEHRLPPSGAFRRIHPKQLLNDIAICGGCRHLMAVNYSRGRHYYHCTKSSSAPNTTCRNSIPGAALDEKAWAWFVNELEHPEQVLTYLYQQFKEAQTAFRDAKARKQTNEEKLAKLVDALVEATSDAARGGIEFSIGRTREALAHDIEDCALRESEMDQATAELMRARTNLERGAGLLKTCESLEERRYLLKLLGARIVVHRDKHVEASLASWVGAGECGFDMVSAQ